MAATVHNDEPCIIGSTDVLERNLLVAKIAETLADCQAPQVFGVHGDWGSGKTSVLHGLFSYLTGEPPPSGSRMPDYDGKHLSLDRFKRITVVWFEAWRSASDAA